ncbi:hypothetical protein SAMN05216229_101258 [Geopseudomonas sagittaria]|uniref:Uncharacterized protein n=1 Tax=Geopseudomonas sagittaria TaxID=1135990 RepID=A0A1I5P0A5_9GAMM|nr:hypothetical protein [Pseudomonas sagittaria]SFP27469.1 hypothetical protein SAMN05216229_101258 [Pseudomonas sagittaria]
MTCRTYSTPEDVLRVPGDVPPGYPIDAIDCALSRADAVVVLLSGQFDGTGAERLADHIVSNALWAVRGELAMLRQLFEHGHQTEAQRVAEDLDKALAAAGKTAQRKGGAQ